MSIREEIELQLVNSPFNNINPYSGDAATLDHDTFAYDTVFEAYAVRDILFRLADYIDELRGTG